MVFASLVFLYLFLPLNLILYFCTKNLRWRNWVLIGFSLFFYAWGEPVWVGVLLCCALLDFVNGLVIERYRGTFWAKVALGASFAINLGLLVLFKYSGFLYENINLLLGTAWASPTWGLPVGISFYTFQSITYTVGVYRGEVPAQRSFSKLLLFISCYHRLMAGPIVRYSQISEELEHRIHQPGELSRGITRFLVGLTKKVLVANTAGALATKYLDGDLTALAPASAWFGLLLFTLQIYYDFSGYSDMSLGLGWMFGFHYPENFQYPYTAKTVGEFWRRWHISLGSFFRDYVYIPLGGNRKHQYINLFVVWFLTGLWHGASWNYVLWGLYFGLLIALERLFLGKVLSALPRIVSHIYLMFTVMMGWALFYFTDTHRLGAFVKALFGLSGSADPRLGFAVSSHLLWLAGALLFCIPVVPWLRGKVEQLDSRWQAVAGWGQVALNVGMLLVCTALLVGQTYSPFLYFQF